jgi:hypothetical protein
MTTAKATWTAAYINDLPDANFLYVEPGGTKDEEGKTVPRTNRHFPYKDVSGAVDLPHLRNAAARIPQSNLPQDVKDRLMRKAEALLDEHSPARKDAMTVKFAEGSDTIIEGLGVPFGLDLDGESFGPDTDLCLDWFPKGGRPILYHHGFNDTVKMVAIGHELESTMTDDGLWVRAELDKASKHYAKVKKLIDESAVGYSSGAPDHKVKMGKGSRWARWPLVEYSLTPTPAFPNRVSYAVKTADAIEHLEAVDADIPDSLNEQTQSDSEPESLAEQSGQVLAGLKAWAERMEERSDFRVKFGRELSKANIESLREAHRLIGALLERADAPSEDEADAAKKSLELALAITG